MRKLNRRLTLPYSQVNAWVSLPLPNPAVNNIKYSDLIVIAIESTPHASVIANHSNQLKMSPL